MHDDLKSERMLRYSILATELVLMNLITWSFFKFGWFEEDVRQSLLQTITISTLCYAVCNIGSGVVTHHPWSRADQVIRHTLANVVTFAVMQTLLNLFLKVPIHPLHVFAYYYPSLLLAAILNRLAWRRGLQAFRGARKNMHAVVFVGPLGNAWDLTRSMCRKNSGYAVLGYFADEPDAEAEKCGINYLGIPSEAPLWVVNHEGETNELYCTLLSSRAESEQILRACENHLVRFHVIPGVRNYMHHRMNFEMLNNVPVLSLRNEPLESPFNRGIKRAFDLLCSGIFLCTLFPFIFLILGIAIKVSSPGPVFFKQKRSGQNGREFWCYKFRSMKVNAQSDTMQATKNDPRKTRIGEFMRHTNLDELPQFINVFRGDMSMVGPRPHMLKHTEEYSKLIDKYMVRHLAKPGITGWAQVTGFRGETKELWQMEGRVKKDIWYIEHWTFALDLYIMYKTIANVLGGEKEAY